METYPLRRCTITVIFVDTETTGLKPINSGPFEIAMLVYRDSQLLEEKVFHLNPLDNEVLYHEDAFKVHGVTEEEIKSFPPPAEVVPEIAEFLKKYLPGNPKEKMVFAGYNCKFDYGHVGAILFREGYAISDYFDGRFIDVLEQVQKAKEMRILDHTDNNQLTTITKALEIPHEGAHGAMADIKATRQLYEAIYRKSRRKGQ
jgi:DNA polymerase III epsilon subunit-like protein